MPDPRATFLDAVDDALHRGVLAKLVLGAPCGDDETLKKLQARPVALKAGPRLQLVFRHDRRDVTRNLPYDEVRATIDGLLGAAFRHAHLHTTERSLQLELDDRRPPRLRTGPAQHEAAAPQAHDHQKKRVLEPDPRWLTALGLFGPEGRPKKGLEHKHKQILRFVEVLDHWLGAADRPADGRIRVVDVGCGKGALTFATWQYLRENGWPAAEVVGVELRPELAAKIEGVARELGCDGLSFVAGSIAETPLAGADVVIALHACDTATDDALALGVEAGARWLLVAPCCHKQVRPQLAPPPVLAPALRHGILRTREAELVTDALRAALLEAAGYDAKVFEFTGSEHTDKNLMIAAVRRGGPNERAADRARELAAFYGVGEQRLAERLGVPLASD